MAQIITGLTCPNCGGSLEVSEGERIAKCQFCDAPLLVVGDISLPRFYIPYKVKRLGAFYTARQWFSGWQKASDLRKSGRISDIFLVYLPFWRVSYQVIGVIKGNRVYKDEKRERRMPVERAVSRKYSWEEIAIDPYEFGVRYIPFLPTQLKPFSAEEMRREGMVFEPMETETHARGKAKVVFRSYALDEMDIDEITYEKLFYLKEDISLVYYPLWIVRYLYKERAYQVVIDGVENKILYGRAPGNNSSRSLALIGSLFAGVFLITTVFKDVVPNIFTNIAGDGNLFFGALIIIALASLGGLWIILSGFSKFRYGGEVLEDGGERGRISISLTLRELWRLFIRRA